MASLPTHCHDLRVGVTASAAFRTSFHTAVPYVRVAAA
jgi:hypothetical protein